MKDLIKEILRLLDNTNEQIELEIFHDDWNGSENLIGYLTTDHFGKNLFFSEKKKIQFDTDSVMEIKINQEKICVKIPFDGSEQIG